MMMKKHVVVLLAVAALVPQPLFGQVNAISESWLAEHPEVVERLLRLWLNDPRDPEIDRVEVRYLELESYILSERIDVPLYQPRINPRVSIAPQLLLVYLEDRGVYLSPADLLVGRSFRVDVVEDLE